MTDNEDDELWNNLSEKERIEFIRENGNEIIQKGMDSIFGKNKYKAKKEHMWNNQLDKGKKLVRGILRRGEND